MIEDAWNEYRGWAKRARLLQSSVRLWNTCALGCTVLAAVLGSAASQVPPESIWGKSLAGCAAVAAAVIPILGRHILEVGGEPAWIRARATAESIKSECFKFVAKAGEYGNADAFSLFIAKRTALIAPAARMGLTSSDDPVGREGDKRRPPVPVTQDWYIENRMREQAAYYRDRAAEYEREITFLRTAGLVCALVAAALGAVAGVFQIAGVTQWIGVATTLGAMIVAYGLMERRAYLVASYRATATALGRLHEDPHVGADLQRLVQTAEALLTEENTSWIDRMTKTIPQPAAGTTDSAAKTAA